MKRQMTSMLLAGALLCGLCACGTKTDENTNSTNAALTNNASGQSEQAEPAGQSDPSTPDDTPATPQTKGAETGESTDTSTDTDATGTTPISASAVVTSASTSTSSTPEAADGSPALADIQQDILTKLNITEYMDITAERLLDAYGILTEDVAQSASFTTLSGAFPHEVILVEAVDDAAAKRIAEKLQARLDEVTNQYKDYDAESYALAQACSVDTDGLVVSLLLSPERETMRQILTDSLA